MKVIAALILIGALAAAIFGIVTSIGMDVRDGGDAQVVRVDVPGEVDPQFAQTYKTIAEGNRLNAEADAVTTTANADAAESFTYLLLASVVAAMAVMAFAFVWVVLRD